MTDDGAVTTSRVDGVLHVTLERPSRRNSLSPPMVAAFVDALTDAATDDSLRAVHIRGGGYDFCAGVDWVTANSGERPRTGDLVRRVPHGAHRVIELVHTIHLPVVCSVRGWAAGLGCNLALAADFTVAGADAVFWEPFLDRGFSPDSGSSWLLPRLVGLARAKSMLLLGEKVSGSDAADWGLIHRCVDDSERRRRRGRTVGAVGLRPHCRDRTRQTGHPLRTARDAAADNEPGAVQPGAVVSHQGFQRRTRGVPREARAGVRWPVTHGRKDPPCHLKTSPTRSTDTRPPSR